HALQKLGRAAAKKKAESICSSYQKLRDAAKGVKVEKLFELIDKALGKSVMDLIISSYSHRHCFMCSNGTAQCETCEASGLIEQSRRCPNCNGLGIIACGFCRGTGWADRETIPPELKAAVLQRQSLHVRHELQRLVKSCTGITSKNAGKLSDKTRGALISWFIRLEGRISNLGETGVMGDDEQMRLGALAGKIEAGLKHFRR
ncbi:MAG: hypothetical protein KAU28_00225, partial [Phycisphaerae bacterium]|nr:hypothetical protein [Phycisphaerae bacterium]